MNKTQALEIFEQYPDIFWKTISVHFPNTPMKDEKIHWLDNDERIITSF